MTPELYYAVMLITNPQKARRILLAEDWENWFMDLFEDELEDIFNGTFLINQSNYVERIVDKYLESTGVSVTDTDEYARRVTAKATSTASQIQETTVRNILLPPTKKKQEDNSSEIRDLIAAGIAFGATAYVMDDIKKWLGRERANLIALNEANWIMNAREYQDAINGGKTKKTWHTALDERVRLDHMAVEGVTIPIEDYFIVGGYPMRQPLDENAPIEQTANCRCSLSYS